VNNGMINKTQVAGW